MRGIFAPALAQNIAMVMKSAEDMPAGDPIYHYAGRSSDGKYMIWEHTGGLEGSTTESQYWQAMTAAYALAAMDSGAAGPTWQARFRGATDQPMLGRDFALAFQRMSDTVRKQSLDNIAWIHKNIVPGMSRSATYALIKKRGLIAYNNM